MKINNIIINRYLYIIPLIFSQIIISQNDIKCEFCKKIITSKYIIDKNNKYHLDCYRNYIQLRCDYCNKTIIGNYNIFKNKPAVAGERGRGDLRTAATATLFSELL